MKKILLISILLLFVLASILSLCNRKKFIKYKSLKNHETEMHDVLARVVYPYYCSCLVLPQNINELITFSQQEGYSEINILEQVYNETHIKLTADSIYIFANIDNTDSILDNPISLGESTFWDYFLYKKDIVLFKWNKLPYCELEIMHTKLRKGRLFMEDSAVFRSFHNQLSAHIEEQLPQDLKPPYPKKRKLLIEVDLFQDTIVCRNIIPCEEFSKINKVESIVIEVLSKYKLEKNIYDKAIIPIYILEEAIN